MGMFTYEMKNKVFVFSGETSHIEWQIWKGMFLNASASYTITLDGNPIFQVLVFEVFILTLIVALIGLFVVFILLLFYFCYGFCYGFVMVIV